MRSVVTRSRLAPNRKGSGLVELLELCQLFAASLVSDINPTVGAGSNPQNLVNLDSTLLFSIPVGATAGIYRSDGTAAGTQRLNTTPVYGSLIPAGRQAFFFSGTNLWVTDGTIAGTRLVKNIGATSYEMVALGGAVYFCDNSSTTADGPMRLWRSDGTADGTVVIKTLSERVESPRKHELTRFGNSLYFVASTGSPTSKFDIYKSDGTAAGTVLFKSVLSDNRPSNFYVSGDRLYFNSGDSPAFAGTRTLWTDGVTTNVVTDAGGNPIRASSFLGTIGNLLYFYQFGEAVWKTDGTPAGTVRVGTFFAPVNGQSQAVVGDTLFVVGRNGSDYGNELMKTDGTSVTLVKDINNTSSIADSNPHSLTAFDGKLYFAADDGYNGGELWRSDGTAVGTVLDSDIFAGHSGGGPENLIEISGTLFLSASDAAHGNELFKLTTPLSAPLGLLATQAGDTRITLNWGNPGTSATGFRVERSTDGVNFSEITTITNPATVTYSDTGLTHSTTYYYRVRATTAGGNTPYSGLGVATTAAPLPAAPLSLTLAPVPESSTSVNITWVDNSTNEDGFRVYRSTDPAGTRTYTLAATRPPGTQSYTDTELTPSTTYYYLVASYNSFGEGNSPAVSVTTRRVQAPFGAVAVLPRLVQAENFDNGGPTIAYLDLTASNTGGQYRNSDGVDIYTTTDTGGFRVESAAGEWMEYTVDAGTTGGTFPVELRAATASSGGRVRLDVDGTAIGGFDLLNTGSASSFRTFQLGSITLTAGIHIVRLAIDANPSGQPGVELNWIRFSGPLAVPSPAPSNLVAAGLSRTAVSLTWTQQTMGETGFSIERRLASKSTGWAVVGLTDVDATAYDDPTIEPNTSYVYRVRAENAAGASAYSNDAAVTTPDAPAVLVKDINTHSPDSNPRSLVGANGLTYFVADDGVAADGQLWVSNGKAAGTLRLTTDMKPTRLTAVGNVLFFTNDRGAGSSLDAELWKSDGSVAGTVLVKDIFPGPVNSSIPDHLTNIDGTLYFTAVDASGGGRELWKSDGTSAGTVIVRDINPSGSSNPSNIVGLNGKVIFTAEDGTTGTSLWMSDGTFAGTQLIADLFPGPDALSIDLMTVAGAGGGFAYFRSNTGELWRTDGTPGGSLKVSSLHPSQLIVVGNDAYFSVGTELWKSDGTVNGAVMLSNAASTGPTGFATDGITVYYFATVTGEQGFRLWRSNGTPAGTGPITSASLAPWTYQAAPTELRHASGGHLFFSADDGINGLELWTSDGTAGGTRLVKEIQAGSQGARPQGITNLGGGVVLFAASSSDPGRELWRSDGTDAGTTLVKDVRPLPSDYSNPSTFTTVGNLTYFWANFSELWKTDGTEAGTQLIKYVQATGSANPWPSPLINVNGTVYFYSYGAGAGAELFKTDGTAAGTVRVTDLIPGPADSFFASMTAINGMLYFGGPGTGGSEYGLWRTDGTPEGTVLLENLAAGYLGFYNITGVGSSIYFTTAHYLNDGGVNYTLWRSNGTVGSATALRTFDTSLGAPNRFTPIGDVLYFQSGDGSNTPKLWRSDGTVVGTTVLFGGYSEFLTHIGSTLYFVAGGSELWKSDGTPAGTVKLHAFDPMQGNQFAVRDLTVVGNQLLFLGQEAATGREPWRSDGTVAGTKIVADLAPGSGSSYPDMFTDGGNGKAYFRALGNAAGLWQSDGTSAGTQSITRPTLIDIGMTADKLAAAPNGDLLFSAQEAVHSRELWKAYGAPPAPVGQATLGGGTDVSLTWSLGGGTAGLASLTLDPSAPTQAALTTYAVTGYGIERRIGTTGAWTQIAIAAGDATAYIDRSATSGTTYAYRIRAVGSGGESYSDPIVPIVAAPAPVLQTITVGDGSAQRSQVTKLTLAFDLPVTIAAGALSLVRLNTGGSGADDGSNPTDATNALSTPTSTDGGRTWLITFAATSTFMQTSGGSATGSLVDGVYRLSVDPSKIAAAGVAMSAAPAPFTFHRLFGDVTGDAAVNPLDYLKFRQSFGTNSTDAGFDPAFDFNADGAVNPLDYSQFRNRFGKAFTYAAS